MGVRRNRKIEKERREVGGKKDKRKNKGKGWESVPGQGTEEALGQNKEQIKGNGIVSKERVSLMEQSDKVMKG